jgi:hypothetical protein
MVCCSYRGYWTSRGRPSEKDIAKDAVAALQWTKGDCHRRAPQSGNKSHQIPVIIWCQSIGAGAATNVAANRFSDDLALKVLIMETRF